MQNSIVLVEEYAPFVVESQERLSNLMGPRLEEVPRVAGGTIASDCSSIRTVELRNIAWRVRVLHREEAGRCCWRMTAGGSCDYWDPMGGCRDLSACGGISSWEAEILLANFSRLGPNPGYLSRNILLPIFSVDKFYGPLPWPLQVQLDQCSQRGSP